MGLYLSPFQRIIRFIINAMYMESGFLNLGSTASCAEATFLPATLDFGTKVAGYVSSSATPLEGTVDIDLDNTEIDTPYVGEALTTGQQSKALVGTLSTTVTDICSNVYTNVDPIYGNATTHQCKFAQRYVPASLYSGKLRLYVQAVYGSIRQDYYVVPLTLSTADTYDLNIGGYRLHQAIATSGIFTTSDYVYYMMECNVNSVTFKKLKISSVAQGWIDILKTHPNRTDREFSSKVEAYVLSTAIIDPDFTPVISTTGLSVSEGGPYAYGFHFNWAGSQAKVVWVRSVGDGTYRNRIITLDIADDLTVVGSESAEEAWSNSQYFQFWYPDMFDGVMKTQGVIPAPSINSSGCPMYGYFDYHDVWQEFAVSVQLASTAPYTSDTGDINNTHLANTYGYDTIEFTRVKEVLASTRMMGNIGYSYRDESISFGISSGLTRYFWGDAVVYGGIYNSYPMESNNAGAMTRDYGRIFDHMVATYPAPAGQNRIGWIYSPSSGYKYRLGSATGVFPTVVHSWKAVKTRTASSIAFNTYWDKTGITEAAEICFGVTFSDCESIVFGHFNSESWNTYRSGGGASGHTTTAPQLKIQTQTGLTPQTNTNYVDFETVDLKVTITQFGAGSISVTNQGAGTASSTTIKIASSNRDGWTFDLVDDDIIKTASGNDLAPSGWAEKYFRVGDLSGNFHPLMQARASANGAHILYHDEGTGKNENGYPDGVYSSAGWV